MLADYLSVSSITIPLLMIRYDCHSQQLEHEIGRDNSENLTDGQMARVGWSWPSGQGVLADNLVFRVSKGRGIDVNVIWNKTEERVSC